MKTTDSMQLTAAHTDDAPRRLSSAWLDVSLLLIFGLITIAPLLQPGYFWGAHDARHDVYFIFEYAKSVQEGILFPRWSPDWAFGYGYPFFTVYGPLATFVGVLAHQLLGLGYEASVKAVLALSVIASGFAMYGFARSWLGRAAGLVAAVAYMTVPYHLVDVYVRAAMAESVALIFLPLALWGFRETVVRPRLAAIIGAGAAFAALMWTSNLVALIFTPALGLYVLFLLLARPPEERKGRNALVALVRGAVAPGLALLTGLGLSAAFFVPALMESAYINRTQWYGQYYDPAQHFVYLFQLFDPSWGFGISKPGPVEASQGGLSFQLGAAVTILSFIALVTARRLAQRTRREVYFWALWAAASIFLMLDISALVWRYVPIVPYAQFPWRYLMLAILPLSILPATLVARPVWSAEALLPHSGGNADPIWPALMLGSLLLLSSAPYLRVENREPTVEQGPASMAALMRFQRTSDEMTGVTAWVDPEQRPHWSDMADLWVQGKDVTTRVDYSAIPQDRTLAVNSEDVGTAHEQTYFYTEEEGKTVTFNRFWYPGWTAWLLDGKDGRPVRKLPLAREDGPLARVVVSIPKGEGYLLLRFEDTPLRAGAKWVTLATLGVTVGVVIATLVSRSRRKVSAS
jgi:hypothetical protein